MAWADGAGRTLEDIDLGPDPPWGLLGRLASFVKKPFWCGRNAIKPGRRGLDRPK
jgi:hypothetical protein